MSIRSWSTTASSNNAAPPNGWPEGQSPGSVNNVGRQMMAEVRDTFENMPYFDWGDTPTRVDNDTFTVSGDLTSRYAVDRRIKLVGATTGYATIASSSYSAPNTTVTVTMDSGNVPTSLVTVSLGPDLTAAGAVTPYFRITPAELAAGVTPVNYAYPQLSSGTDIRRYGGTADNTTDNAAAINSAIAVVTESGGGVILFAETGTYKTSGSVTLPSYTALKGTGYGTILKYTGSGSFITLGSSSSRVQISEMMIIGTSRTGTGIVLGDISGNVGWVDMYRVLISEFNLGMRMGGATWLTCRKCEFGNASGTALGSITNNVGIDFNYFGSANYSSALTFDECVVSNNANAGVQATSVSITMNNVQWINCTVQNNCQSSTSTAQFYMGVVTGFTIDAMYMEYVLGGTAPDAIRADNLNNGSIRNCYINTAANAIKDRGGGSMNQVEIDGIQMLGITTAAISCASEVDVVVRSTVLGGGTVTLTGSGCKHLPIGSGLASWPTVTSTFTPTLTGSGGGTPTYTTQAGIYSKVGNVISFKLRIDISAVGTLAGQISIAGLPTASVNSGNGDVFPTFTAGITPSGSNNSFVCFLALNSTSMAFYGCGTATPAQVVAGALSASTSIVASGSYQTTS